MILLIVILMFPLMLFVESWSNGDKQPEPELGSQEQLYKFLEDLR